jgi:hypothetical protein
MREPLEKPRSPLADGRAFDSRVDLRDHGLLGLHAAAGNHAVASLLRGRAPPGLAPPAGRALVAQRSCASCAAAEREGVQAACCADVDERQSDSRSTSTATLQRFLPGMAGLPAQMLAAVRQDVVVLTSGDEFQVNEASALAAAGGRSITAYDLPTLVAELGKVDVPINRLIFVGHSGPSGNIYMGQDLTKATAVSLGQLAGALKGVVKKEFAPRSVQFKSCSLGAAGAQLDQLRKTLGAGDAEAPSCWRAVRTRGPITLTSKKGKFTITTSVQLDDLEKKFPGAKQRFDASFLKLVTGFGPMTDCVQGVPSGKKATDPDGIAALKEVYFKNGGYIIADFVNPTLDKTYKPGTSKCYKDLPVVSSKDYNPAMGCVLVRSS